MSVHEAAPAGVAGATRYTLGIRSARGARQLGVGLPPHAEEVVVDGVPVSGAGPVTFAGADELRLEVTLPDDAVLRVWDVADLAPALTPGAERQEVAAHFGHRSVRFATVALYRPIGR